MGYAIVFGPCCACGHSFGYHPNFVPSIFVHGKKEPVCEDCMRVANEKRKANGVPIVEIHPQAYEPCREEELRWN